MTGNEWMRIGASLAGLALLAWLAHVVARSVFLGLVRRFARRTTTTWDDRLVEQRFFRRLAQVAPALVTYYGAGVALGVTPAEALAGTDPQALGVALLVIPRVSAAFIVLAGAMATSSALAAANTIYNETYPEARNRPIKGYLQVVSIFVFIAAGIWMVAIVADRSPVVFLSGLGALTAVLLLVFRDTILSLVASVQIMSNDMIRLGDWVEMPQAHADGDVIDIALHTVKIQNWDKTITTIPTHKFISESFRNWRGMQEAGGRRIKRAIHIDLSSVHFLDDEEVERLARYEFLHAYLGQKREELQRVNRTPGEDGIIPERRRLTNVGTFRAYVLHYLRQHPRVHQDMTLLVRQLEPGPQGLPLQIYCFTNDTAWASYEGIQADIFDHVIAVLPEFGLRAFQEPAGSDFQVLLGVAHG